MTQTATEPKIGDNPRQVSHRAVDTDGASAPSIGAVMQDGTIFAGISPDTGKSMYAMPAGMLLTYTFNEAQRLADHANARKAQGHDDWRMPTRDELNGLFNNCAAIGGFDLGGSYPSGWYWSGTAVNEGNVWCQRFKGGSQNSNHTGNYSSLRLVRTEAPGVESISVPSQEVV